MSPMVAQIIVRQAAKLFKLGITFDAEESLNEALTQGEMEPPNAIDYFDMLHKVELAIREAA